MTSNIANEAAAAVPAPSSLQQTGAQADQTTTANQGPETTITAVTAVAPATGISARPVPVGTFNIFAGPNCRRFAIDINDLRRESSFFRTSTAITSVELRRENPLAIEIVVKWFTGNIGQPPVTREARELFVEAAGIAKQLHIKECEAQLLVIVHKTTTTLANIFFDQLETSTVLNPGQVGSLVTTEMEGYMTRSTNTGGIANSDGGLDHYNVV